MFLFLAVQTSETARLTSPGFRLVTMSSLLCEMTFFLIQFNFLPHTLNYVHISAGQIGTGQCPSVMVALV